MTGATGVLFWALSLSTALVANAQAQVRVESFSGSGQAGFTNSEGQVGQFNRPHGLAIDGKGNIYVSDRGNHAIRVVAGKVLVLAGTGTKGFANGPASAAQFNEPYGVALSPDEKTLYVADYLNHAIRAIDLAGKQVTTLAGNGTAGFANGVADKAQFNQPYNVKADANGRLYVPDQNNHAIRRVDPDGTVSTIAGNGQSGFADGKPPEARFNNPTGLIIAADGTIYVADRNNHRIRAVSPAGDITTIAGDGTAGQQDGPAQTAKFNRPIDVVLARDGSLVVSEENNHRLRKILLR
jgi:sugar lactone lactonase YvrE